MSNIKKSVPTTGQKKLHAMGINLPLLPLTTAGSLPKHIELTELRYKVSRGVASMLDLERRERLSTEGWMREQSKAGLDVLVDGEMGRGDLISFFARKINGFQNGGSVRIYGNRYHQKPVIREKLSWKESLISAQWQANQRATQKPVKAVITGAYTLMDCSFNDFYKSREEALADLVEILHKEVLALADAGAKIIQIDEISLGARPEEFELVASSLKQITKNVNAYFILRHGYDDISQLWPKISSLPIDNFYFEGTNSNLAWLPCLKKMATDKDITVGTVDSHSHLVEPTNAIEKLIKNCLKVIPAKNLWIATDGGLKTRTPDEATGKLANLAKAVIKIREKI